MMKVKQFKGTMGASVIATGAVVVFCLFAIAACDSGAKLSQKQAREAVVGQRIGAMDNSGMSVQVTASNLKELKVEKADYDGKTAIATLRLKIVTKYGLSETATVTGTIVAEFVKKGRWLWVAQHKGNLKTVVH